MGVKRQWGNRKRRFSVLSDAIFSQPWEIMPTLLYSVIQYHVAFPLTSNSKYNTVNDLE